MRAQTFLKQLKSFRRIRLRPSRRIHFPHIFLHNHIHSIPHLMMLHRYANIEVTANNPMMQKTAMYRNYLHR
jgi:hypothetical protein